MRTKDQFEIDWRATLVTVAIFLAVVAIFGLMSLLFRWPNRESGWTAAVLISLGIALLPVIARAVSFLQRTGGSIETPWAKLNFAIATIQKEFEILAEELVQKGTVVTESGSEQLEEAARLAARETVVVIDLEDGRAWYITRLFAVAATAVFMGAPKVIVLIGQRGGRQQQVGGSIRPDAIVQALCASDERYESAHRRSNDYMARLHSGIVASDPKLPRLARYDLAYQRKGDAAIMRILIDQMQSPEPVPDPSPGLESGPNPPWVTLQEAEIKLGAWLTRDLVDLDKPDREQVSTVLSADGDYVVATRAGRFSGIVDVSRAVRQIVRQLAEPTMRA